MIKESKLISIKFLMISIFICVLTMGGMVKASSLSGITTVSSLNMRISANIKSKVIKSIPKGTKVNIIKDQNGWYNINYLGKSGWIAKQYVKLTPTGKASNSNKQNTSKKDNTKHNKDNYEVNKIPEKKYATVKTYTCLVRTSPNSDSKILLTLYKQNVVKTLSYFDNWYEVKTSYGSGWIYKSDITVSNTYKKLMPEQTDYLSQSLDLDKVVSVTKSYLGIPYVWGGTSTKGFDCSGLTQYVYKKLGINIPRVSYAQVNVGKDIWDKDDLRKGDLIFFFTNSNNLAQVSHVGISIGNRQFIEASSSLGKVKISSIDTKYFDTVFYVGKRIVKEDK